MEDIAKATLLKAIYEAQQTDPGYKFVGPEEGRELAAAGLVELNETIIDDYGGIAARLTPSGVWQVENAGQPAKQEGNDMAKANDATTATAAATPATEGNKFTITKGGFTPPARKSFNRPSMYPFDDLDVGDFFFVAGKTAEQIASTVTAANKRFSEETGETETFNFKGEQKTRNVRKPLRRFAAVDVEGGVNVGRIPLD